MFGEDGYVIVEGLGASYGNERLIAGRRDFDGPFRDDVTEFRGGDISWKEEWKEFVQARLTASASRWQRTRRAAAMRVALAAYEAEKTGRIVKIK